MCLADSEVSLFCVYLYQCNKCRLFSCFCWWTTILAPAYTLDFLLSLADGSSSIFAGFSARLISSGLCRASNARVRLSIETVFCGPLMSFVTVCLWILMNWWGPSFLGARLSTDHLAPTRLLSSSRLEVCSSGPSRQFRILNVFSSSS